MTKTNIQDSQKKEAQDSAKADVKAKMDESGAEKKGIMMDQESFNAKVQILKKELQSVTDQFVRNIITQYDPPKGYHLKIEKITKVVS